MLRPARSLLDSSRADRRRALRQERIRAIAHSLRRLRAVGTDAVGASIDLALLVGLPALYLAASFLVLDLPGRWLLHGAPVEAVGLAAFLAALTVSLAGILRFARDFPPIAPVRPQFAKAMLLVCWAAALLFAAVDLKR